MNILTYHVYAGAVSSEVTDGMTVTMLNGDDASSHTDNSRSNDDDTQTLSNGVIQVIDKVLMPTLQGRRHSLSNTHHCSRIGSSNMYFIWTYENYTMMGQTVT